MDKAKRKRLEEKGWTVGNAYDFLGFTPEEKEIAEAAGRAGGRVLGGFCGIGDKMKEIITEIVKILMTIVYKQATDEKIFEMLLVLKQKLEEME